MRTEDEVRNELKQLDGCENWEQIYTWIEGKLEMIDIDDPEDYPDDMVFTSKALSKAERASIISRRDTLRWVLGKEF